MMARFRTCSLTFTVVFVVLLGYVGCDDPGTTQDVIDLIQAYLQQGEPIYSVLIFRNGVGGGLASVRDVNDACQAVGDVDLPEQPLPGTPDQTFSPASAFVFDGTNATTFNPTSQPTVFAVGVAPDGTTVIQAGDPGNMQSAIIVTPPGMPSVPLGPSPIGNGMRLSGQDVNQFGNVVGSETTPNGSQAYANFGAQTVSIGGLPGALESEAFGISDNNLVVGESMFGPQDRRPWVWDGSGVSPLNLGTAIAGTARGINNDEIIVGGVIPMGGSLTAAKWEREPPTGRTSAMLLPMLFSDADFSLATDINNAGMIVGYTAPSNQPRVATLWYENEERGINTAINLNDLIPANAGIVLRTAFSVSDTGKIAGEGILTATGEDVGFVLVPNLPDFTPPPGGVQIITVMAPPVAEEDDGAGDDGDGESEPEQVGVHLDPCIELDHGLGESLLGLVGHLFPVDTAETVDFTGWHVAFDVTGPSGAPSLTAPAAADGTFSATLTINAFGTYSFALNSVTAPDETVFPAGSTPELTVHPISINVGASEVSCSR
jgi:hypothetical protein